jgi:hypothetical protein
MSDREDRDRGFALWRQEEIRVGRMERDRTDDRDEESEQRKMMWLEYWGRKAGVVTYEEADVDQDNGRVG